MNKNKKKALAVLLGFMSVGKSVSAMSRSVPAQYASAFDYFDYLKLGGIGVASAAVVALPLTLYFSLRGKKDAVKPGFKNVNYPFKGVIPVYHWQNGNCFFLSSLYNMFAPEDVEIYEKVAKMEVKEIAKIFLDYYIKNVPENEREITNNEVNNFDTFYTTEHGHEVERWSCGFKELCNLFVRQQKADPNQSFQIIPDDFHNENKAKYEVVDQPNDEEYQYERKMCGGELLDRTAGSGRFSEVIGCFTGTRPFLKAFGCKSIFANWSQQYTDIGLGKLVEKVKRINDARKDNITSNETINLGEQKWNFKLDDVKKLGLVGLSERQIIRDSNGEVVKLEEDTTTMDENGKIEINGESYRLAAISKTSGNSEGHINCYQPKYKVESGKIVLAGVLTFNCLGGVHQFNRYNSLSKFFSSLGLKCGYKIDEYEDNKKIKNIKIELLGALGFTFRFTPEKNIEKYSEYYCYNG